MTRIRRPFCVAPFLGPFFLLTALSNAAENASLWELAQSKSGVHRFSTLFTAQDVSRSLNSDAGLDAAVAWCKAIGVTKVYLEVYRDNHQAERSVLEQAKDRFQKERFVVHGCVTPTRIGKLSKGWNVISCYTDATTRQKTEEIFRYAASLFDVVMIDDFWFTDCSCDECQKAKGDRSWADYRLALMNRVSQENVIQPARQVNPKVKLIIKYPEWYDLFHERGYDVVRESELFDITWIGTETRDPDNSRWGKKPQFGAYWISLWAAAFSRGKLAGGWFDPLGTTPKTYVEQSRQTILGQCRESMLFCYGALLRENGPDDIAALRPEIPGLLELAAFVSGEKARGVGTYKLPHSPAGNDMYIFNFLGMLGIPMTAETAFPAAAPALLLTEHATADPRLESLLTQALEEKRPMLVTSNLSKGLSASLRERMTAASVPVLALEVGKKSTYGVLDSVRALMQLDRQQADSLRRPLLEPLGVELSAPPLVSLFLYGQRKAVLENFRDEPVELTFSLHGASDLRSSIVLPPGAEVKLERSGNNSTKVTLPPRSLVALQSH